MTKNANKFVQLTNGRAVDLDMIPLLPFEVFKQIILDGTAAAHRVSAMFADTSSESDATWLYVVSVCDFRT